MFGQHTAWGDKAVRRYKVQGRKRVGYRAVRTAASRLAQLFLSHGWLPRRHARFHESPHQRRGPPADVDIARNTELTLSR